MNFLLRTLATKLTGKGTDQVHGGGLQIGALSSLRFDSVQPIGGIGPIRASRGFISINIRSKAIATTLTIRNKVFIVVDCRTNEGN